MLPEYRPEPLTDFSLEPNRRAQAAALDQVLKTVGREFPNRIAGKDAGSKATFASHDPSEPKRVVGVFPKQTAEASRAAVAAALDAFPAWSRQDPLERAAVLLRAAAAMKRRRFELNAWEILEVGKTWPEADADVAEAIDFCEFYAREALRLAGPQPLTPYPGELNELRYIPLGVGAVIPPWNFPLAILCGMTTAAIVCGNTVVVKPASDSPAMGALLMGILEDAGLPPGVVNFITGPGGAVGDALVTDPRVRFVAFTGSMEVGLALHEQAARPQKGQAFIRRTILEMGGKDFILVDEDADLDAAATGIVASAFGFQGQKCSACSRAILHERVHDAVLERVVAQTRALTVGSPQDPSINLGPVINRSAFDRIHDAIASGKKDGRLVAGGEPVAEGGHFIRPTVIDGLEPTARLAREEIFGPVLAVLKARDFSRGLQLANDTIFGLTGAVYTRNREHLARARREAHAGNLYLNRKCTGALVGVHPFGGFNMSGTDSKAGGRDYLLLFTQAKLISERL